jgi:hypothetical protein
MAKNASVTLPKTKIGQFGYPAAHYRRMRQSGRLPAPIISPISSKESKGRRSRSLTFDRGHATPSGPLAGLDPGGAWELKFFARFIDRATTRGNRNEAFDRSSRYNVRVIQRSVRTERYVGRFERDYARPVNARR